ncbi:MAG: transposase [Nitrospinae bacterium]|nr:transposase [Nitrospinota bacterium]
MGTEKRKYTKEFKLEAVRLAMQGDRPMSETAQELGVHPNILYKWVRDHKADPAQAFPGKGRLRADEEEISRLKRDYERVKMERDILKKAMAIFSQPQK